MRYFSFFFCLNLPMPSGGHRLFTVSTRKQNHAQLSGKNEAFDITLFPISDFLLL
jgi:hypothetical protein